MALSMSVETNSGTVGRLFCSCCRMQMSKDMYSNRQKRQQRNRKCSVCIAAEKPNLKFSWDGLSIISEQYNQEDDKVLAKRLKKAKRGFRRRLNIWLNSNQGIYLRADILKQALRKNNFQDNYEDYVLLCYNCGYRDGNITATESQGCAHNKIRDTFKLADAIMESSQYDYFSPHVVKIICSYLDCKKSTVVQIPICAMMEDFIKWNNIHGAHVFDGRRTRDFFVNEPEPKPQPRFSASSRYNASRNRRKKQKPTKKHFQDVGWG